MLEIVPRHPTLGREPNLKWPAWAPRCGYYIVSRGSKRGSPRMINPCCRGHLADVDDEVTTQRGLVSYLSVDPWAINTALMVKIRSPGVES